MDSDLGISLVLLAMCVTAHQFCKQCVRLNEVIKAAEALALLVDVLILTSGKYFLLHLGKDALIHLIEMAEGVLLVVAVFSIGIVPLLEQFLDELL